MAGDAMPLLIGFTIRATLVIAFAWGLTAAMRRASASARHIVWTCALLGAAVVPAVALLGPRWEVATSIASSLPARPGVIADEAPAGPSVSVANAAETAVTPASALAPHRPPVSYTAMALAAWGVGAAAVLLYMIVGVLSAVQLRRRAARTRALPEEDAQAIADAFRITQPIAIVASDAVTTPMVCGIWRPVIVMPGVAADWPEERRHLVLLHELAHIKRRDCLTQVLAQIVCAGYWFNPLVWFAAHRLRAERERACDDFVLAAGTRGSDYAGHLLEIAQASQPGRFSPIATAAVAMARRSQLEGRLMAILDPATRRSSAFYTRLAAAVLVALVSIPAAAVHLVSPAQVPDRGARLQPVLKQINGDLFREDSNPPAAPAIEQAGAAQAPARPADDRLRATLNKSLLHFADEGDVDGVEAMLTAGADINAQIDGDGSPLIAAADEGHVDIVRLLLDRGANPNLAVDGDGSALIAAAGEGHADVVRLLLDRNADPNLVVHGDGTALTAAAGEGHTAVVDLLLRRGAQVDLQAEEDGTALIAAANEGHVDLVALLLDRGADPNLVTPDNGTALIAAAEEGHADVVDLLLRRGAQVNLIAEGNETALIQASDEGHLDVVQLLVSGGADVNLGVWAERIDWVGNRVVRRGPELRTPLNRARQERHSAIVAFLISAGARD
jgi:ankyrin repeat protein/beta-lactamase regulating signal transducer with metallopeptidase domain